MCDVIPSIPKTDTFYANAFVDVEYKVGYANV